LSLNFVDGCSPSPWVESTRYVTAAYRNYLAQHPNKVGHIGAAVAHLQLWKTLVRENRPHLIVEDDVSFCPAFNTRYRAAVQQLQQKRCEWDILLLGFACPCSFDSCREKKQNSRLSPSSRIVEVDYFMGLWGYVVNGSRACYRLIHSALPLDQPIDHVLSRLIGTKTIRVYGHVPHLVFHPGRMEVCQEDYVVRKDSRGYRSDTNQIYP
jgi:GR25 family glycosyltransferase involved in LPS biosynthesis